MNVAVTGASGYVGGAIAREFERRGHQVLRLSRRTCTGNWRYFSLGDDPAELPWDGIDALVHAAYDFAPRGWDKIRTSNVDPSIRLLAAAHQAGVRRIVFISSLSAFEGCRSLYGKAKFMIEGEALAIGGAVIRPGLVWGDCPGGMMGSLEKIVRDLPVVPFLSGAGGLRQFLVHEKDLADSVVSHTFRNTETKIVPIAHPNSLTLREIVLGISRKRKLGRLFFPVPWQFMMAFLKIAECGGIALPFRSDSLKGLINGNSSVVFETKGAPNSVRPFQ
jgi:nucleoside-diphosphate-sugar epimerase